MHLPRRMITFTENHIRFTYRIGAIVLHNEHVLCERAGGSRPFWFLPGGRAELGETATESLQREMQEELGITASVSRLVYVMENFFEQHGGRDHEVGLYFLVTFPPDSYLYAQNGSFEREDEAGHHLLFDWLPLTALEGLSIRPRFFRRALLALPECTTHVINVGK